MPQTKQPKFKSKTYSLSPALIREVKEEAQARSWPESIVARDALRMWLDKYGKKPKEQAS